MKIQVTSLDEAKSLSKKDHNFTHVISILDTARHGDDFKDQFPKFDIPHLKLRADDVILRNCLPHEKLFNIDQGRMVVDFIKDIDNNSNVLVHCKAGISRSTAIAFILLVEKNNLGPMKAMEELLKIRKQAWPNEHIIAVFDRLLNKDHELDEFIFEWQKQNAGLFNV